MSEANEPPGDEGKEEGKWVEDLALAMHCVWDEKDRVEWAARGPLTLLDFFPELSAPRGGIRYLKPPVEYTFDLRGVSDELLEVLMGGYPQPVDRSVDEERSK